MWPPGSRLPLPALATLASAVLVGGCGGGDDQLRWSWSQRNSILEIAYGRGTDFPQYGALHLDTSYLRLIATRSSGWGTSVVLMPALWEGGQYYQGAPVTLGPIGEVRGILYVGVTGTIRGIAVSELLTIQPPASGTIRASVAATATGSAQLDDRPGEAFKPVMLSSMHVDGTRWDAEAVLVDGTETPLVTQGWLLSPPASGHAFGLKGGSSAWKTNAPTVLIEWPQSTQVTGWITSSTDPNDDNLGLWTATDHVLAEWAYTVVVGSTAGA